MKLLSDIINDLVNDQFSLSVALNKTKVLATRIDNSALLSWVNFELNGYPNNDSLPDYRKTRGTIIGDFINNGYQVRNYPLPLPSIGERLDEQLREFRVLDNITTLEGFVRANNQDNDSLISLFPHDLKNTIENIMRNNDPYFQLTSVGVKVPFHFTIEVLAIVKNKLLDFMLKLETEFGFETEIADLKDNKGKINNIMNTTINNNGDGNIVNTGTEATITANIHVVKNNKETLRKLLTNSGVNSLDVTELLNVIDSETVTDSKFGVNVNTWIQKMISKSLDGSWQVGIGAAGTLLAEAIKGYYGA